MKAIAFIINDKHMTFMILHGNEINLLGGKLGNLRKKKTEMYVKIE